MKLVRGDLFFAASMRRPSRRNSSLRNLLEYICPNAVFSGLLDLFIVPIQLQFMLSAESTGAVNYDLGTKKP